MKRAVSDLVAAVDRLVEWSRRTGDWVPEGTPWAEVIVACNRLRPGSERGSVGVVAEGSQELRVLQVVAETGAMGATAFQVSVKVGVSPNQVGARFVGLRAKGLVEPLVVEGVVVCRGTAARRRGRVHVVSVDGFRELRRHRNMPVTDGGG